MLAIISRHNYYAIVILYTMKTINVYSAVVIKSEPKRTSGFSNWFFDWFACVCSPLIFSVRVQGFVDNVIHLWCNGMVGVCVEGLWCTVLLGNVISVCDQFEDIGDVWWVLILRCGIGYLGSRSLCFVLTCDGFRI